MIPARSVREMRLACCSAALTGRESAMAVATFCCLRETERKQGRVLLSLEIISKQRLHLYLALWAGMTRELSTCRMSSQDSRWCFVGLSPLEQPSETFHRLVWTRDISHTHLSSTRTHFFHEGHHIWRQHFVWERCCQKDFVFECACVCVWVSD